MDEHLTPEQQAIKAACMENGITRTMSMDRYEAALSAYIPNVTPPVAELEYPIRAMHARAEEYEREQGE